MPSGQGKTHDDELARPLWMQPTSCDAEAQENRQPDVMQRAIVVEIPSLCTDGW